MIGLIRRYIRHRKKVCLTCGAPRMDMCNHCWPCSLKIVRDYDEDRGDALEREYERINKPVYFEEEENPNGERTDTTTGAGQSE